MDVPKEVSIMWTKGQLKQLHGAKTERWEGVLRCCLSVRGGRLGLKDKDRDNVKAATKRNIIFFRQGQNPGVKIN